MVRQVKVSSERMLAVEEELPIRSLDDGGWLFVVRMILKVDDPLISIMSDDGLTRETSIYSWKRARKLFTGHMEIRVDGTMTRQRLMREIQLRRQRDSSRRH